MEIRPIPTHFNYLAGSLALRLPSWNMLDHLNPNDVTAYVSNDLKSRYCDTPECNSEINTLVDFLIAELPYQISHIIRVRFCFMGFQITRRRDLTPRIKASISFHTASSVVHVFSVSFRVCLFSVTAKASNNFLLRILFCIGGRKFVNNKANFFINLLIR